MEELDADVLCDIMRRAATIKVRDMWAVMRVVCKKMENTSFAHLQELLGLRAKRTQVLWFASGLNNDRFTTPLKYAVPACCVETTLEADVIREAIRLYMTRSVALAMRTVYNDREIMRYIMKNLLGRFQKAPSKQIGLAF